MNEENLAHFARNEFKRAVADFAKTNPQESLLRFYRRLDAASEGAIQAAGRKPACRHGCAYCCYYKVEARALEVLVIHEFVRRHFSQEQLQHAIDQATHNVEEAKNLSHVEHLATNQRCPFLVEGGCSIYPVRPAKCRNFHASDVDGCKASYDEPTNLNIPNS
ncbi:MAG: YkgJ family cysteine cluster protein [Gammaproteobacteria bacterium]|nr:YkgJ family cysteine cluster protein [Gammaproteobacteria bacterium]